MSLLTKRCAHKLLEHRKGKRVTDPLVYPSAKAFHAKREHPPPGYIPPCPFEQVEARRGPGRPRRKRNRRHGRPRGR